MIEVTILNYLNSVQNLPKVVMEVPENPPTKFYVMQKTGGSRENHIFRSTFAVQSYAGTKAEAAAMNETVIGLMLDGLITQNDVASVSLNSNYDFTDTEEKRYRYQAVFDIVHY